MLISTCWGIYFSYSGFFFKYYLFFYNHEDASVLIVIIENIIEFVQVIILSGIAVNLQTIPITVMVLLCSKLNILIDEFKELEYNSDEQFNEIIGKLVNYHGNLQK